MRPTMCVLPCILEQTGLHPPDHIAQISIPIAETIHLFGSFRGLAKMEAD
ncbi:MAG: hypothetical protein ABJJ53_06505 [Sulfitobacter sp.]